MRGLIPMVLAASMTTAGIGVAAMTSSSSDNLERLQSHAELVIVASGAVDFGIVGPETESERVMHVLNTGDRPVTIERIKTKCGCTTVEMPEDRIIEAGEVQAIPVTLKSPATERRKEAEVVLLFEDHAPVRTALTIETVTTLEQDASAIDLSMQLAETLDPELSIIAPDFHVSELGDDGTMHGSVWLVNSGQGPLDIAKIRPSCGCTSVPSFAPLTLEAGGAHHLDVFIKQPTERELAKASDESRNHLTKTLRVQLADARSVDLKVRIILD